MKTLPAASASSNSPSPTSRSCAMPSLPYPRPATQIPFFGVAVE